MARGPAGVGEGVDRAQQVDAFLDGLGVLVAVDAERLGDVEDRLDDQVGVRRAGRGAGRGRGGRGPRRGPRRAPRRARSRGGGRRGRPAGAAGPGRGCAARRAGRRAAPSPATGVGRLRRPPGSAWRARAARLALRRGRRCDSSSRTRRSAGRASQPKARERSRSREAPSCSGRVARISATRVRVASTQAASPAVTRAMTSRSPVASVRLSETWRRRCSCAAARVVGGPVGLDDLGLGDRDDAARALSPGDRGRDGVVDHVDHVGGQAPGQGGDLARDPGLGRPGRAPAPRCGAGGAAGRGRRPRPRRAARVCTPRAMPSSHRDSSRTLGVPSPPSWSSRSPPGGRGRPGVGRGSSRGSLACRSAQCATSSRSSTSAARRWRTPPRAPPAWRRRRARRSGGGPCLMIFAHRSSTRLWATSGRAPRAVNAGCPAPAHLRRLGADSAHICADSAMLLRRRW